MRRKKNNWKKYMSGEVGDKGYYIKNGYGSYGPFKTQEIAEFFNFIAFGSPRSLEAEAQSKFGIDFYNSGLDSTLHPKFMFNQTPHFNMWWRDTFGIPLTSKMVLQLAKECRANGYKSFINWLLAGSKIGGHQPHSQYYSTLG